MRIAVLGQGAWGMALAHALRQSGRAIIGWTRRDPPETLCGADLILAAVPAQATRDVLVRLSPAIARDCPLILTAKGLEKETMLRQSQIAAEILPEQPVGVLSGPAFAGDLINSLPTAVTLATQAATGEAWQQALSTLELRVYLSGDVTGVELGGALKNVIAIACGVAHGAGLGESARAALLARGFAEISRIGVAAGASESTLAGLSGLGDLVLTATSSQSRNTQFGVSLGASGNALTTGTFEGASSAGAASALAASLNVPAPIIQSVAALVSGGTTVPEAIEALFNRPLTRE